MIGEYTRERPPPDLIADLMHGAAGRPYPHSSIAPSHAPRHSSRSPLAEPRQRTAQVRDLDAAAVTNPAARERLPDRLADPLENRLRARLANPTPATTSIAAETGVRSRRTTRPIVIGSSP